MYQFVSMFLSLSQQPREVAECWQPGVTVDCLGARELDNFLGKEPYFCGMASTAVEEKMVAKEATSVSFMLKIKEWILLPRVTANECVEARRT